MSDQDQGEKLFDWLNGDSAAGEIEQLKETSDLDGMSRWISSFDRVQPEISFDPEGGFAKLEEAMGGKVAMVRRVPWWLSVAASCLVLLGVFWILRDSGETVVATDVVRSIELPDHSTVALRPGAQLEYAPRKFAGERTLRLDGSAFFKVAKGEQFTVETSLGEVVVIGTAFSVRSDSVFAVECYEGEVEVHLKGAMKVNVKAGERINDAKEEGVSKNILAKPWWLDNTFEIVDGELPIVASLLSEHFERSIRVSSSLQLRFDGYLSTTSLDEALATLTSALDVEVETDDQGVIHLLP